MLWPVVLPFQITACLIAVIVCCVTIAAPKLRWKRLPTFYATMLLGGLLFVPSCVGVMKVIDQSRFGVFQYTSFSEVDDFRVERYLPPTATNITIDKRAHGFRAKFTVSQEQLGEFLNDVWTSHGDVSVSPRDVASELRIFALELHQLKFGDLGWPHLSDAVELNGPYARNGAGFSVYYSPSQQIAYQQGGYW